MRAVAAAVVVVLVGCGGRAPEPLPPVVQAPHPVEVITPKRRPLKVPRPAVEIQDPRPDLSEEPRWPLTIMQHPTLEPQFHVAGVLADPGIAWTELCARGVQYRKDPSHRDELAYLGAWCAAEQHDAKTAVTALTPLRNSSVPGIANGVPFDLVNVLVGSVDADHAIQLLTDLRLRDAHLYDLLAAAYFEIGKNDDAVRATSTAMQVDAHPVVATTCHRLAREVLLGSDGWRPRLLERLHNLATQVVGDSACAELHADLTCALAGDCAAYYARENIDFGTAGLAILWHGWDEPRGWRGWIDVAYKANRLQPQRGAKELTLAALDAAVVAGDCTDQALQDISRAADAMGGPVQPKAAWLHTLVDQPTECARFRAQWLVDHPQ